LKKSAWKKKLAAWAFESKNLREAACLHACGENEVGDYRGFSLRNPIALLPNAISEEWVGSVGDGTRFRARYNIPEQARMMLYLSRITPKKGLPMLLEAMATLRKQSEPWVLAIAGTEEFGHQAELKEQTRALDLGKQVIFAGPQHGQDKRDAYAAADLFVLPTHSEGSPIVVLEALGAGIPVLTTKGAPWADLERYRCGWWSEISTDGIYEALREASGLTTSALAEAGARGKALVRSKYNWNEIASKTIRLYDWLAGRCAQPEFVITD
jgi:glycosyltransferase involved in cell wall biosynthesis